MPVEGSNAEVAEKFHSALGCSNDLLMTAMQDPETMDLIRSIVQREPVKLSKEMVRALSMEIGRNWQVAREFLEECEPHIEPTIRRLSAQDPAFGIELKKLLVLGGQLSARTLNSMRGEIRRAAIDNRSRV